MYSSNSREDRIQVTKAGLVTSEPPMPSGRTAVPSTTTDYNHYLSQQSSSYQYSSYSNTAAPQQSSSYQYSSYNNVATPLNQPINLAQSYTTSNSYSRNEQSNGATSSGWAARGSQQASYSQSSAAIPDGPTIKKRSGNMASPSPNPVRPEPRVIYDERMSHRNDNLYDSTKLMGSQMTMDTFASQRNLASGLQTSDVFRPSLRASVTERTLEPRLVDVRQGQPKVIEVNEGQSRVVNERTIIGEPRVANQVEMKRVRRSESREAVRHNVEVEKVQRKKVIELINQKPVPYEVIQDVRYDVIVDVPIERTIEKEIIYNVKVEKPIEKIVEVPVEQIYEVPVEKIYEVPVEVKRYVQKQVEKNVPVPYDVIKENFVVRENIIDVDERDISKYPNAEILPTRLEYEHKKKLVEKPVYIDNIIERPIQVPKQKYIEVPKEVTVEKKIPIFVERKVPVDKVVYKEVEVQVPQERRQIVEYVTERPRYVENIIEKPVPVEKLVPRDVIVPVEKIVEVPKFYDNIIEKQVANIVEIPVPQVSMTEIPRDEFHEINVLVERVKEKPVEKLVRKSILKVKRVEVPYEKIVHNIIEKPVVIEINKPVKRFNEKKVEKIIEKPAFIERLIEKPKIVEKTIELPVARTIDNVRTVEKTVERPVMIDTVIEKEVEKIVIKDIPVPVEKIIPVEVAVVVERPVFKEVLVEEDLNVETHDTNFQDYTQEEIFEHEDEQMHEEIKQRESELNNYMRENSNLKQQYSSAQMELNQIKYGTTTADVRENIKLHAQYDELHNKMTQSTHMYEQMINNSIKKSQAYNTVVRKDPRVDVLRTRLQSLISENNTLADQLSYTRDKIRQEINRQ